MGLINSEPNLHLWGKEPSESVTVRLSRICLLKGLCKYAPKNSQITCSSISLENKRVIHCSDPNTKHIRIVKLTGASWNRIHIQSTSNACEWTHEHGLERQENKQPNL